MILKNYWGIKYCQDKYRAIYASLADANGGLVDLNGNPAGFKYCSTINSAQTIAESYIKNYSTFTDNSIRVGTGTAEPLYSDYALTDDVTASFSNVTLSITETFGNSGIERLITCSGVNNTENDITITEWGMTKKIYNSTDEKTVLIAKVLLSEPILVEAGNGFTFVMSWKEL